MKEKYSYLIKNFGLFTLSSFATRILSFLILPFYTYCLTQQEYAIIDLMNLTVTLLMPILSLSISDALLRFSMDKTCDKNQVLTVSIVFVAIAILLAVLGIPFIERYLPIGEYKIFFIIIFTLSLLNLFYANFMRAVDRMLAVALSSTAISFSTICLNVYFIAFLHQGLRGYFISTSIGLLVGNIIYFFYGNVWQRFSLKLFSFHLTKKMLSYSLPLIPNSLFWWINSGLDKYMLTFFCNLSTVGLYSVAGKIPSIISVFVSIFQQAWTISAIREIDDESAFYRKIYRVFETLLLILAMALILLCKPIAHILFQKSFYEAWKFVPFLIMATYFNALNSFIGSIYIALNMTKNIFVTTAVGALANIILNYFLIPVFEGNGAAVATLISTFLIWGIRYRRMYSYIAVKKDWMESIVIFLVLLIISLNVVWFNSIWLSVGGISLILLVLYRRKGVKEL